LDVTRFTSKTDRGESVSGRRGGKGGFGQNVFSVLSFGGRGFYNKASSYDSFIVDVDGEGVFLADDEVGIFEVAVEGGRGGCRRGWSEDGIVREVRRGGRCASDWKRVERRGR
jgi:hypothetical protein